MSWGISGQGWDIELYRGIFAEKQAYEALVTSCEYIPNDRLTIEHKQDRRAQHTGNLFIEYEQKGKPSGIMTSQADFWMLEYMPKRWLLVSRMEVIQAVMHFFEDSDRNRCGGDYDNYRGVLVPVSWFMTGAA